MELRGGLVLLFATMHLGICQENYGLFATDAGGYIYAFNQDMSYVIYNIGVQVIGIAVDPYSRDHDQNIVFSTLEQTGSPLRSLDIEALQMHVLFNAHAFGAYIDRIAIEHNTKHVYFSAVGQPGSSFIGLFTPDGHFRRLVTDLHTPRAIKLDTRSRRLYYTDHGGEEPHIGCANFDGTSSEKLVTTDIGWPNGLDIDFNSNKLLWTDGLLSKIESYDLSTGERNIVMRFDGLQLMDILLDGDAYFFLAWGYNYIFKASLISHEITDYHQVNGSLRLDALAVYSPYTHQRPAFTDCDNRDGLGDCSDICILSEEGHVCSCDEGYKLLENEKTCENAELCPRLMSPAGIADSSCYRHQQDTCQQVCFAGYSGTGEASFCENSTWHDSNDCEIDENWHSEGEGDNYRLFVTDKQGLIYGLNPDGRVIETVGAVDTAENTRLAQAIGLGVDHHTTDFSTSFVYSTFETSGFYMYRKQLNIPEADLVLNTTKFGAYIDRFAIEPKSKNIYFTAVVQGDAGKSFISVLSPRGDHVPLFGGLNEPRDIILDTRYSLLFRTDHSQIYPYIGWAYMDGSGASYLITQEIYPIKWPNGLALDQAANLLFWTDGDTETINSYDLFEGTIQTIMSVPHSHLMDIQIDGHYFLYLDWQNVGVITKVNMNDLNDMTTFRISGAERLDAMALYSGNTQSLDGDVKCADRNGRGDCSDVCLPNDNGYVCACDHQVDFTDEDQKTCANAQLCPKTIRNVILSDSCRRHDLEVCDFYCAAGFSSASTKINCENKVWNLADPCQPDCRQLDPLVNGMIESSHGNSYQSVATFKCKTGYNLEGPTTRMCESGGVWSNRNPVCHMIECSETLDLPNGIVTLSNNQWYGSKATFECNIGHQISEEVVRTCMETGKWSHSSPTCARIECSETLDLLNGIVTLSDNQWYGSEATFECNIGHQISEEVVRTCMETGKWSQSSPSCARIECSETLDFPNGIVTLSDNQWYGSEATFKCNRGHQISEEVVRTCMETGKWSQSSPSCARIECSETLDLRNGIVTLSDNQWYGSEATFVCNTGHQISEEVVRTCMETGKWSQSSPTCARIECLETLDLPNGIITLSDNQWYGSEATFECNIGHQISEEVVRTCMETGKWSQSSPTCARIECSETLGLPNGIVTLSDNQWYGSEATFKCNRGHQISEEVVRTCMETGKWSQSSPTCVRIECSETLDLRNGIVTLSDNQWYGSEATFKCNTGHQISEEVVRTCMETGKWSQSSPTCARIKCSETLDLHNGIVTLSDNQWYGSEATFECNTGHQISEEVVRTCMETGKWSQSSPTCVRIECSETLDLRNGIVTLSDNQWYGSEATFECNAGHQISEEVVRTCMETGKWSQSSPTCARIECLETLDLRNGIVTLSDNQWHGSEATFECNTGHQISEEVVRTCMETGKWSQSSPTCARIECSETLDLRNGIVTLSDNQWYGSEATFECNKGHQISEEVVRTCMETGKWSQSSPTCARIECLETLDLRNGIVTLSDNQWYGSEATFECNTGHQISEEVARTCMETGKWSQSSPTCARIECSETLELRNGIVTLSDNQWYGSEATFECNTGHQISEEVVRTCMETGKWSQSSPTCARIECSETLHLRNGIVTLSDNQWYGSEATFECNTGHQISEEVVRTCMETGKWSQSSPTCARIECSETLDLRNGIVTLSDNQWYGSEATFECNSGHQISEEVVRTCMETGKWSQSSPTCARIECLETLDLRNGIVTLSDNQWYGSEATFECNSGHQISEEVVRTCMETGKWSQSSPTCARIECSEKLDLRNGIVTLSDNQWYGSEATFECNTGHQISEEVVRTCMETGKWSQSSPTCARIECSETLDLRNGIVTLSDNQWYGSRATFECNTGHQISEEVVRTCMETGKWSQRSPTCARMETTTTSKATTTNQQTTISAGSSSASSASPTTSEPPTECRPLTKPENGTMVLSNGVSFGSVASFSCSVGYKLLGPSNLTCYTDGSWTSDAPKCQRIECSKIVHPDYATVTYSDELFYNTKVQFDCCHDCERKGPRRIWCQANGTWTKDPPTCIPPETMTTSKATTTNQPTILSPTTTTVSEGSASASSESSTTSGPLTECRPLTKPENGTMVLSNGVSFGSVASFGCSVGYKLQGSNSLTCQTNGSWTNDAPKCQRIECSKIVHPNYATVTYSDELFYNTKVQFDCCHDCERKGPRRIWCQANGTWTKDPPTCIPPETTTASISTSNTSTASQPTSSTPTATTGAASSTSSGPATECRALRKPENGTMNQSSGVSFGSIVEFSCSVGFKLQGPSTLTCYTNGSWSNDVPKCQRIECPKVVHPENANVTYSDGLFYDSKVQFDCCIDCERKGPRRIWCQANGTWTKEPPTCTPPETTTASISTSDTSTASLRTSSTPTAKTTAASSTSSEPPTECRALSKPENGTMNQSSGVSFGSVVEFNCSVGFKLQGPSTITCLTNGYWSNDVPKCQRIECPKVVHPENANVTYSDGSFYNSKVQFDCCIDCERTGPRRIWCQANGTWTKEPPTCIPPEQPSTSSSKSPTVTASTMSSTKAPTVTQNPNPDQGEGAGGIIKPGIPLTAVAMLFVLYI